MKETQKPFACSVRGCEMTFTNEDHLNWHQKKHDMMLNLGLANKNNEVADQTPTPTRFIRNCEEVGLFQDLQNVNPFDEFFKKAVETAKTGGTLEVPEANPDDTLHTPHILPHIEENQKNINKSSSNRDDNNSQSNEFSLNSVIPIDGTDDPSGQNHVNECSTTTVAIKEPSCETDVKKKIKAALQSREEQRSKKENSTNTGEPRMKISVVPYQNLAIVRETANKSTVNQPQNDCVVSESKEKIREMNRAAQIRCRKRKQIRWKEMEEEINILKEENKKLRMENYSLQLQILQTKEKALNATNNEPIQGTVIGTILPLLPVADNLKSHKKVSANTSKSTRCSNISPKEIGSLENPIVIQILQSSSNVKIPVLQSSEPSNVIKVQDVQCSTKHHLKVDQEQKASKRKNLRKIIPKIIIEN